MSGTSGPRVGRCITADIDLDALAQAYSHRPLSAAGRSHAARAVDGLGAHCRALDVGGGPGHHAAVWAEHGIESFVLDPGATMVAAAANHSGVSAIRGAAQRMPLSDRTMDVVYFHLSIHYGDWRRAFDESLRVVKAGGAIWVWTLGPDHHASSFLRRWFPRIEELDRVRFPDPEVMAHYLRRRATVTLGSEVEAKTRPAGEWAAAVRAGFVSTLQLLTPAETAAGMRAFADAYPDPAAPVEYALRWTWLKVRS